MVASLKKVIGTATPSPTFLDGRDAILRCIPALASRRAAQIEAAVRAAFAKFGMGRNARCQDTSFNNIREDFTP